MKAINTFNQALKLVFVRPAYYVLTLSVVLIVLGIIILLPNHEFVTYTLFSHNFSLIEKLKLISVSFGAIKTNFTFISRLFAILISLVAGINISFLTYYFRTRLSAQRVAGVSMFGVFAGFLGIGCSACGSVILSSIFGIGATTGVLAFLPFKGTEINVLSLVILLYSTYYIAKKIQSPEVCEIKPIKNNKS